MKKYKIIIRKPFISNKRSNSMVKTKKKFKLNIINKKIWIESINKFIKIKFTAKDMRLMNKNINKFLKLINIK